MLALRLLSGITEVRVPIKDLDRPRMVAVCHEGQCIGAGIVTPEQPYFDVDGVPVDSELEVVLGASPGFERENTSWITAIAQHMRDGGERYPRGDQLPKAAINTDRCTGVAEQL